MIAIISVVAILAVIYFLLPPAGRAAVMSPGSDEDADGLTAFEEFRLGTDPILADTDADGFPDKAELAVDCLDPLNADVDDDGLIDGDDPFACEPAEVDAAPQQVNITSITIIREDDMMDSGEMDPDYESDEAAAEGGNRTPLHYHVEFETVGFTPQTRDFHIHFFYNTVSPENSGIPGDGPWQVHQTSDPFEGYIVADKPAEATAICAVVANPDHTTIAATAQCTDLPDS